MQKEFIEYLQKYASFKNVISTVEAKYFVKCLEKCTVFEAPDAFYVEDNNVIIYEHFRFDSSKGTKKGTREYISKANNAREAEKILKENPSATVHKNLNVNRSSEYFLANLMNAFKKHYAKIEFYKANIASNLQKPISELNFTVAFIIENTTVFGDCFYENGNPILVTLNKVNEFLTLMVNHKYVDLVIYSTEAYGNDSSITIAFSQKNVSNLMVNSYKILTKQLLEVPIMEMEFGIKIEQ